MARGGVRLTVRSVGLTLKGLDEWLPCQGKPRFVLECQQPEIRVCIRFARAQRGSA